MATVKPSPTSAKGVISALFAIIIALCAVATHGQAVAPKLSVPDAAGLKSSRKAVDELFGKQISAAKQPAEKVALAKALFKTGAGETSDPGARYVLLSLSKDLAAEAGDLDGALQSIAEIDRLYSVNFPAMQVETLRIASRDALTPAARKAFLVATTAVFEQAIAAEQFESAHQIGESRITMARKANDAATVLATQSRLNDVALMESARREMLAASEVLKKNPADAPANLAVGKYRCFNKGDWEGGLPLLAIGGDPELNLLAQKEISGAGKTETPVTIGDAWWDYSKIQKGRFKVSAMRRAGTWYEKAQSQLAGLAKARVKARLKEIAAVSPHRVIDLLKLVDPARDAMAGGWHFENGLLWNDPAAEAQLRFPYQPPAEYDYTVEYKRDDGHWGAAVVFCRPGGIGGCVFHANGTALVFVDPPGGQPASAFQAIVQNIESGCTARLQVRDDGLSVFVNGQRVIDRRMVDWIPAKPTYAPADPLALGVVAFWGKMTIKSAEVTELSGAGTLLR